MRFTVMKLNGYEPHREDDANLVSHIFSSVDFMFANFGCQWSQLDVPEFPHKTVLVHEAFTSQVCSRCFLKMEGKQIGGKKVHGVMVCRNCYSADRHPLHWHRDINAARNMVAIYQHLASERLRPTCFTLSD